MIDSRTTTAINATADMNAAARDARRLCTDIIRQTSLKPYYGKRGGAAMYAADDRSAEQRKRLDDAINHLLAATELLRDIAVAGGLAEAQAHEIMKQDYWTRRRIQAE